MDIINQIKDNIAVVIAAFGGLNIVLAVSTIMRTFSQRRMNNNFDLFNLGTKKYEKLADDSKQVFDEIKNSFGGLKEFKQTATDFKKLVDELLTDSSLQEIKEALKDLSIMREALDFKDNLIKTYSTDLKDIKLVLMEIKKAGGFDDILEVKEKA